MAFHPIIGPPEAGIFHRPPYLSVGILTVPDKLPRLYVSGKMRLCHQWRRLTVPLPWRRA